MSVSKFVCGAGLTIMPRRICLNSTVWKEITGESGAALHNAHIGNPMDAKDAWPVQGTSISMDSPSIVSDARGVPENSRLPLSRAGF